MSGIPSPSPDASDPQPYAAMEPFDRRIFWRRIALDAGFGWGLLVAAVVVLAGGVLSSLDDQLPWNIALIAIAVAWLALNVRSGGVLRRLPALAAQLERDPAGAESQIATMLDRKPLQRGVRLLLYHQLATLRHKQQRFVETAEICESVLKVLGERSRRRREMMVHRVRIHLLLMLVDAQLSLHNFAGGQRALGLLQQRNMDLGEQLQLMALQTRYDIATGQDHRALGQVTATISMSELMPAPQCGNVHLLLSIAAQRQKQVSLANWLNRRGELLCSPEQLDNFRESMLGMTADRHVE